MGMLCLGGSMVVMLVFVSMWEHAYDGFEEMLDRGWLRPSCCFL